MNRIDIRAAIWIVFLAGASFLFSGAFACAMPFAALAALAALHLRRRRAVAAIGLAWIANQLYGYCVLAYPQTWDSFAWGAAIGISAVVALIAARAAVMRSADGIAAAAATFVAAFAGYEGTLYAATAVLPSEPDGFVFSVVAYVFIVNAAAFAGLLAVQKAGTTFKLAPPPAA